MLNDPQIVEASRFIAQRMLKDGGATTEKRITWAFRLVTGRTPSDREQSVLMTLWTEQHELFATDQADATELLAVGESKPDASLDHDDLAAGTVLALTLLNHDAAVMRR